jgi:hypothetical protein
MSHPNQNQEYPVQVANTEDVDSSGRLVPRSEAERMAHSVALRAALDDIAAIGPDATDAAEVWDEVFRGIDSARPHRPLFGEHD